LRPNVHEQLDRQAIRLGERRFVEAELAAPIRIGAPGRGLQQDAHTVTRGDGRILVEIAA